MLGILYSLVITFLPVVIYQRVILRFGRILTREHRQWTYALVIYLWTVFYVTGIGSVWDIAEKGGLAASLRQANFCWMPFENGIMLTSLLNVLLFMPLGFMVPHIWTHYRSAIKVTLMGAALSVAIELAQIPTNRAVDLEDLLMNTLGTYLGFVFWRSIGNYLFQGHVTERILLLSRREPIVYLLMTFLCQFVFYNWRWFA